MHAAARFYREWLWVAFRHSFGRSDAIAGFVGVLFPAVAKWLGKPEVAMSDLTWEIPLCFFATLFFFRLALAPYWMFKDEQAKSIAEQERFFEENRRLTAELLVHKERIKMLETRHLAIVFRDNDPMFISSEGYFGFRIKNTSPLRTIEGIRVRLVAIYALGNFGPGENETELVADPHYDRILHPKGKSYFDDESFNLNNEEMAYFDFVKFFENANRIRVIYEEQSASFLLPALPHKLTIRVTGRDTPASDMTFVVGLNSSRKLICEVDKSG